jgi:hypothetical protein
MHGCAQREGGGDPTILAKRERDEEYSLEGVQLVTEKQYCTELAGE